MKIIFILIVFLFTTYHGSAHLCHDPFRPSEHLILAPEKDRISIEEAGEFRIYVENTFTSVLRYLRLIVDSDAFDIEVQPSVLKDLVPGERTYFLVKLALREGFKPGNYPLKISVDAESAEITPSTEKIDVMTEKRPTEELEKQPLPTPIIEPSKPLKEDKYLEEDIRKVEEEIPVEQEQKENYQELPPQQRVQEPLIQKDQESEKPVSQKIEELHQEEIEGSPEEIGEIVVEVKKVPFYKKPYFYLLFILLLLGILIWRKIK